MTLRLAAALAPLALAACVPPAPEPTPAPPAAAPSPPTMTISRPGPTQPRYSNWQDAPQTPGDWTYAGNGQTSSATFGAAGREPRFRISCDRASKRITLSRLGIIAAQGDAMTIRTESADRALPTLTPDRRVAETLAHLPASDPLLDAMAFSKGRFAVEFGELPLYLPSWPEVTRVIEDCR